MKFLRSPSSRLCAAAGPAFVILLYATWAGGRISLGYWPQPSVDDPQNIPGLALPYLLIKIAQLLVPAAALLPILTATQAVFTRNPEKNWRLIDAAAITALHAASILFLRWDPHSVATWFAD
jgi:hypothetical protein